ncbi:MAG: lysylphosphatidylglycerol synthase transmembrane domain-containing protein [Candidatus Sumerlaeia bacterium]
MTSKKKRIVSLVVGLVISAVFLAYSLKSVNFADLLTSFRRVNYVWIVPFCVVTMLSFYLRALRWQFLLPGCRTSALRLFPPLMIGFAFNGIFPARAGEFARAFVLKTRDGVPFGKGFGSVVMERLFDGLTMLIMLLVALRFLTVPPGLDLEYGGYRITSEQFNALADKAFWPFVVIFLGVLFILFGKTRALLEQIILRLPLLPRGMKEKITGLLHSFADGLGSIRDPRRIALVIVLSVAIWLLVAWSQQLLSFGFGDFQMSFLQSLMVMLVVVVAIMVPAAPGYWGLYELGGMFGMVIVGLVQNTESGRAVALSFIILVHALQMILTIGFGMWYAARAHISLSQVESAAETIEKAPAALH